MKRSITPPINALACLLAGLAGTGIARAQTDTMDVSTNAAAAEIPPAYQPFSIGAEAGTTGFGGTAGWRFANHLGVAGGADYFSLSMNRTISNIPYSANVRLQSENIGLRLYPFKKSSFYIGLGAYFNQNQLKGDAVSDGTLVVGGYTVPAGDSVHLLYKQQPVDPYVSIGGNVYFDKHHHVSLGGELGVFYLGNPKVSVTDSPSGTIPQSDLNSYQQQAEHDLKKIPVWPILKVSLNFSF